MTDLFNVPVFFILFRETVEIALVLSILFSFIQRLFAPESLIYKHLRRKIWMGTFIGGALCIVIGAAFIVAWYTALKDLWHSAEDIWEGAFCFVTSILTTLAALAMIKTNKLEQKWKVRLANTLEDKSRHGGFCAKLQRRSFLLLPMVTVLREGIEIIIYTAGVSLNIPPESVPIPAVLGFVCGVLFGYLLYRGNSLVTARWLFIISSIILCLIAAGLLSRAVAYMEEYSWNKVIEAEHRRHTDDIIDYRVSTSVWYVTWGDTDATTTNGGWQLFRAIFGWSNLATVHTIGAYIAYWMTIILILTYLYWSEKREATRKARLDEWKEADIALEHAEDFVDPNGDIIHVVRIDDSETTTSTTCTPDKHHSMDYIGNVMTIGLRNYVPSRQL